MKNSVYKNKGANTSPRVELGFLLRKNKGGKYTSAPARAVAFFASQKTRRYVCRLILGGLAL